MAKKPHFIREWRKHRHLTLEQLGERIGMTHQNLGKIERFVVPYNQGLLERLAEALGTEPASLIMRNPTDKAASWTLLESLSPVQRRQTFTFMEAIKADTAESER